MWSHRTDCRPAMQARQNGSTDGHAAAASGVKLPAGAEPAAPGVPAGAKGAPNGVHVAVTSGCNAQLTAQVAAAEPWEDPSEAERKRTQFFDPDFSPVAESFDVNPEARLCPSSAKCECMDCHCYHCIASSPERLGLSRSPGSTGVSDSQGLQHERM